MPRFLNCFFFQLEINGLFHCSVPFETALALPTPFHAGNQHVAFISSHDAFRRLNVDGLLNLLSENANWFFT